jgi:hypothetical protein
MFRLTNLPEVYVFLVMVFAEPVMAGSRWNGRPLAPSLYQSSRGITIPPPGTSVNPQILATRWLLREGSKHNLLNLRHFGHVMQGPFGSDTTLGVGFLTLPRGEAVRHLNGFWATA